MALYIGRRLIGRRKVSRRRRRRRRPRSGWKAGRYRRPRRWQLAADAVSTKEALNVSGGATFHLMLAGRRDSGGGGGDRWHSRRRQCRARRCDATKHGRRCGGGG